MISGTPNPTACFGIHAGFEAVHIFPVANEDEWELEGYGRFIKDDAPPEDISLSKINSAQNGLLMTATVHSLWVAYSISVNPDDQYRITCFSPNSFGLDGRTLSPRCLKPQKDLHLSPGSSGNNSPIPPVNPGLLRWHFHKAILANMRGPAPDLAWEQDFEGVDMLYELQQTGGIEVPRRMEVELFTRLGGATGRPTGAGMSEGFLGVERAIEEDKRMLDEQEGEEEEEEEQIAPEVAGALFPGYISED